MPADDISTLVMAASGTSQKSYASLFKLDALVSRRGDGDVMVEALPVFLGHLTLDKLQHLGRGNQANADVVHRARFCLSALTRPSEQDSSALLVLVNPRCADLVRHAAADILSWSSYLLKLYFDDPSQQSNEAAADAVVRSLSLLKDDAFCIPQAIDVVFLAWLKEAHDKQFRALVSKHGDHTAAAMYDLLETSVNPDPTPEEERHILVLTARFSESSDALIQAAFRHVGLVKLGPSVNLPHLYAAMSLVILLLRIPSVKSHPAIFTKHSVTTVARVFAFLACEGKDIRSDRDKKRVLNMCSLVVQYCCFYLNDAFMRKDSTPWIAPAIDAGFLSGIVAARYWISDEFSSLVQGSRGMQVLQGALKFCEETVVGYLWLYSVFEAVSAVVDDMRRKNTLGTSEFIRALARLVLSWRPLAAQVRSRSDFKVSRCCYTKCPSPNDPHLILKTCAGCRQAKFCSIACQAGAWRHEWKGGDDHRATCLPRTRRIAEKLPLTGFRDIAFVQTVFAHELRLHGRVAPKALVRGANMEMRMGLPNPTCQVAMDDPLISASTRTGAVGDKDRIPSASFDRWSDVLECGAHGYPVRVTMPASIQQAKPECPSIYFIQDTTNDSPEPDLWRRALE